MQLRRQPLFKRCCEETTLFIDDIISSPLLKLGFCGRGTFGARSGDPRDAARRVSRRSVALVAQKRRELHRALKSRKVFNSRIRCLGAVASSICRPINKVVVPPGMFRPSHPRSKLNGDLVVWKTNSSHFLRGRHLFCISYKFSGGLKCVMKH